MSNKWVNSHQSRENRRARYQLCRMAGASVSQASYLRDMRNYNFRKFTKIWLGVELDLPTDNRHKEAKEEAKK